jgi:hypothetical protein
MLDLSGRYSRLGQDRTGQVSFSVIAVLALMASVAAGAYFAERELDEADAEKRERMVEDMVASISSVLDEVHLCAAARAQSVVSEWDEFPVNETRISEAYSSSVLAYLKAAFPREDSGSYTEVSNWTGGLFFMEKRTFDLVPDDEPERGMVEADGTSLELEEPPAATAEVLAETTSTPYYLALGNMTVLVSAGDTTVWRDVSFEEPIVSSLPLIESKLRVMESSSTGEYSDLGGLVSSMLQTLGEVRVLEGYGVPIYSGHGSSEIITEQDVYRAVAVGLLLEQARLFRDVDEAFASEVASACGGDTLGLSAIYGRDKVFAEPGELFLWFLGRTDLSIAPTMVVAQAVQGLIDQLVVKVMEYMGWLGAMDMLDQAAEAVADSVDSLISFMTGEDKAYVAVRAWVDKTLYSSGASPEAYSHLFYDAQDMLVAVPERTYFVENAAGELFPVWVGNLSVGVDLPEYDIRSSPAWSGFYGDFKECQASMRELMADSFMRLSFDIASCASVDISGACPDPFDGADLFTRLAEGTGDMELRFDPVAMLSAVSGLPMFSAQAELADRFAGFVEANGDQLFDPGLLDAAYEDMASELLASARYAYIPELAVPVEEQLGAIVANDVASDLDWGVCCSTSAVYDTICAGLLRSISNYVQYAAQCSDDASAGPLVDAVATMLVYGAETFPGLESVVEDQLGAFAKGVLSQKALSPDKPSVYLDLTSPFEFWDGDRDAAVAEGEVLEEELSVTVPDGLQPMQVVPYDPAVGYGSIDGLVPVDHILVQLRRPWEFDPAVSEYPNVHMTSLLNISAAPYSTQWTVSVSALVRTAVTSELSSLQSVLTDGDVSSESVIEVNLRIPVVLHSSWALEGVQYNPTNTILSDGVAAAKKFCEVVWDTVEPAVRWVFGGMERVLNFAQRAFEVISSFATRVVQAMSVCMQITVEVLQKYLQKFADSALAKAVKVFIDIVGTVELRISLHGFTIIIQTNLPDLLFRDARDLVRIMFCTDRFGPGITFGLRIAKLADGRYDIVANGTIAFEKTVIEVAVDPLMHVLRRLVEVHCKSEDWGLDILIPDVEPYEIAEVSTADIAGAGALLSNIPIPVLGVTASVEAGLRMKYSPPFPKDVVVNEFEANPAGEDSGREWVELYNPLKEARVVDGWTISTVHGTSKSLTLSGTVPAGGVRVFTFPDTSIDNGYSDDPFNDGDAIVVCDAQGRVVDTTSIMRDSENDVRTHQRTWDGGPRWTLRPATKGDSNGPAILLAASDFIAKALFEAFRDAFVQTNLSEVTASLDFLALFAKRVLNNFIENLLSIVGEVIHELTLFIEVTISGAAGTVGTGFRMSFVVSGEAIVDLLRWLVHSVATFIVNLGRPSCPLAYPAFPERFFAGLFVRFEVLFEVGPPKLLTALGASSVPDATLTAVVRVAPNVPALGRLVGRDWGQWRVELGFYLEGAPRSLVEPFMVKDTGDRVDIWLVKALVYGR